MATSQQIGALVVGSIAVGVGTPAALASSRGQDEPSLAQQNQNLFKQFEDQKDRAGLLSRGGADSDERIAIYEQLRPDRIDYCRKMVALARQDPGSSTGRDAALWVISVTGVFELGEYGRPYLEAASILVAHHANDLQVAQTCLGQENTISPPKDLFLEGMHARASDRRARAIITLG